MENIYETDRLLNEYLLFHYGTPADVLPYEFGPAESLEFHKRCVDILIENAGPVRKRAKGLDLGCAVGRSTFELARHCAQVTGIDYSQRFIDAANTIKNKGTMDYWCTGEGLLGRKLTAFPPAGIDASRINFMRGDACTPNTENDLFDLVLIANLIDRLPSPAKCLSSLPNRVKAGGTVLITSPYTWLSEFTPEYEWLGGYVRNETPVKTIDGLRKILKDSFEFLRCQDIPFLIREHARKFQWSVAQGSLWRRR